MSGLHLEKVVIGQSKAAAQGYSLADIPIFNLIYPHYGVSLHRDSGKKRDSNIIHRGKGVEGNLKGPTLGNRENS
ncbi:uncharacterized protein RSE6_12386 [Rhynchosporium secalis]|uniref:Uncharacterized protein n=1 Tax=Rhynchosporium secalis TaxID=38038 RepID=A0A1E1MQA3_RHYSE|nr:uncharacterized protein RSE6_12386 [Rhynchosporium secalis]